MKYVGDMVFALPTVALLAVCWKIGGDLSIALAFCVPSVGAYCLGRGHGADALYKVIKAAHDNKC